LPRVLAPGRRLRIALRSAVIAVVVAIPLVTPPTRSHDLFDEPGTHGLRAQASAVSDLSWVLGPDAGALWDETSLRRATLVAEKARATQARDAREVALTNAVLAGEAVARARRVLDRWIGRIDPETGLLPTSVVEADGNVWAYGDTGSDLYPHLTIAAHLIAPDHYGRLAAVMAAERARSPGLPEDVDLTTDRSLAEDLDDRIFGAAEYAKDGLLPLVDRVGADPWLGRLREVADAVLDASATPTRGRGPIPADSTEVNGDMLQVLARLWWATGDERYLRAARRIGEAYVVDVLPRTAHLPPNRWDFVEMEPLDRRRFRLSDHGNEVLSGLIEWHLAETLHGNPDASVHRPTIRRMLDRLLDRARNEDGLWLRVIEIPSGRVEQEGLTDAWGYIFQAFLTQAIVEERAPDGDPALAAEYREAARRAVLALPDYRFYAWEQGKMDGFADALESAVYLLHALREPVAEAWLDDQMAVLYGFQAPDGAVLDYDLDGNFIRTSLLYGMRLTRGARLDPWPDGGLLGGAEDRGGCLVLAAASRDAWDGRVVLDRPRHALHGGLPIDHPRLNMWPEWFVVADGDAYDVTTTVGRVAVAARRLTGAELAEGLPLALRPGEETFVRVCKAPA
jgi:hypothetical protein